MGYVHLTSSCLSDVIGSSGLSRDRFEAELKRTKPAIENIRERYADGSSSLLHLSEQTDDIVMLETIAARYCDQFDHVVILGTGGSSLGGQMLCSLAVPKASQPTLHFFSNIDPHSIEGMLEQMPQARTGYLVVSKSGSTLETITQFLICLGAVKAAVGQGKVAEHFTAITEPGKNPLRNIAIKHDIAVLDHDPNIGGRYSALSLVGLLPAMISGLDVRAFRGGAASVLSSVVNGGSLEKIEPAVGAAISVGLATENNLSSTIMMPYVDRLEYFGSWFRQLWAESLGKEGMGTTPITAMGTVDQHSQLQLYLDGPSDKLFTLIMLSCSGDGPSVDPNLAVDEAIAYLSGKSVGDLMDAGQRATAEILIRNKRPTRIFQINCLDETSMGALIMHFILETIIAAHLFGVNPFDQPAVEEVKVLAREYLVGQAR
jgi:glucose-6-phosphate isomerase